jgi:hypothetical protein
LVESLFENPCLPIPTENSWIGETLFYKERTNQIKLKSYSVQEFNAGNQCITSDLILVDSLFENPCLPTAQYYIFTEKKSWIGETPFFKEQTNQIKLKSYSVQDFNAGNQCITSDLILVESLFENPCLPSTMFLRKIIVESVRHCFSKNEQTK